MHNENELTLNYKSEVNEIITKSLEGAKQYAELFHCTTTQAFLNIIRTRKFWLRNLKEVNDKDESNRITLPEYESSYYIASFTYSNDISAEHWREYASFDDGILFSVKQSWFTQNIAPLQPDHTEVRDMEIFKSTEVGMHEFYERLELNVPPKAILFSIDDFDFYKVEYDDNKIADMRVAAHINVPATTWSIPVSTIIPKVNGIIKKTEGLCEREGREPYIKNWESEKEVRLKVLLGQVMAHAGVVPLVKERQSQAAVSLSSNAFDHMKIRFSPEYPLGKATRTLNEIRAILPSVEIVILR